MLAALNIRSTQDERPFGFHFDLPQQVLAWRKQRKTPMSTGTVKWFNSTKGYGFISPDEGGEDLFVHHSEIQMQGYRELVEGQKVQFEITQGQKGLQASNVSPA